MVCSTLVYDTIVKDGETGLLVKEYSEEAWIQALTKVIEGESLRKSLAERAFAEVCENWIVTSDKFEKVFQKANATDISAVTSDEAPQAFAHIR
ncbi:MAG: hypothetical protein LBM70_10345 [Victivallales bacterium]|jgi:glycosyltransferase involved in cell wall biosynthesis|nr:hypothetical protein [Victivallales bacterium]